MKIKRIFKILDQIKQAIYRFHPVILHTYTFFTNIYNLLKKILKVLLFNTENKCVCERLISADLILER